MAENAAQAKELPDPLFDHREADLCVACGLCLPVCPTYRLTRSENESPRGRISLIRGLAKNQLQADSDLLDHLVSCTLCLACESACPAGVGYENQMNRAQRWLADQNLRPRSPVEHYLLNAVRKGSGSLARFARVAGSYQRSPVRRVLRGSGLLRLTGLDQLDQAVPEFSATTRFNTAYPAATRQRGRVALFKGCLQDQTDPETLTAAIRLLTRLGFAVDVPEAQGCCGGLHWHTGDEREAQTLAYKNVASFAESDAVLGVASGCGAVLRKYGKLIGKEGELLAEKFQDINAFLANAITRETVFNPLPSRALVHEPCSHRNQLQQNGDVYDILKRIPGLEIDALPDNRFCCGGAGTYSLSQPGLANKMREPKLAALAALRPDYLVTTNIGCALHLKAGLAEHDIDVEIVHPVVLLARQAGELRATASEPCESQPIPDRVST